MTEGLTGISVCWSTGARQLGYYDEKISIHKFLAARTQVHNHYINTQGLLSEWDPGYRSEGLKTSELQMAIIEHRF